MLRKLILLEAAHLNHTESEEEDVLAMQEGLFHPCEEILRTGTLKYPTRVNTCS